MLPEHVLALILTNLLRQTDLFPSAPWSYSTTARTQQDPFYHSTAALRQSILLAAVSRSWRQAAAQAVAALSLPLRVRHNVPASYLSQLLGQLLAGRHSIHLPSPLLAAPPTSSFLNAVSSAALGVGTIPAHRLAQVGAVLSSCTSLRTLVWEHSILPPAWPPTLQHLTLHRLSAPPNALLQGLQGLSNLETLVLHSFSPSAVALAQPACFAPLQALRQLTVHLRHIPKVQPLDLSALAAAAGRGVSLRVQACFDWLDDAAPRLRLWKALAQISPVDHLQLGVDSDVTSSADVSAAERQLLQAISCWQLVTKFWTESCSLQQPLALLSVRAEQLCCELHPYCHGFTIAWSLLAATPGYFVVSSSCGFRVTGCAGGLPAFAQGWALMLKEGPSGVPWLGKLEGLPLGQFVPGPRGHRVWRNSAASDLCLADALAQLAAVHSCGMYLARQRSDASE